MIAFLRDLPIRRKLMVVIATTACLALVIAGIAFATYERTAFRAEAKRTMAAIADVIALNATAALSFENRNDAVELLQSLKVEPDFLLGGLYDREGGLFAAYTREGSGLVNPPSPGPDGTRLDRGTLMLVRPVYLHDERIGTLRVQATLDRVNERLRRYWEIAAVVLLVSLVASLLLSAGVQRAISGPILSLAETARRVSDEKDFTVRVKLRNRDELGVLADAFNGVLAAVEERRDALMRANLSMERQTLELLDGARTVAASASQILEAASQLTRTSSEAALAVGETTDTVHELRQAAEVASHKAQAVARGAREMAEISQAGTKSVEQTVGGIRFVQRQIESVAKNVTHLGERGQVISQIIATVENLAKQSNLLAVNAAIEASKAGEQGKGFSVVAQELRSLAEQSRQATSQVREILGDIRIATNAAVASTEQGSKAVELGVGQSTRAGEAIELLSESVAHAAQSAEEIAATNQQQFATMDHVAAAIEGLRDSANQNLASARQLESAARALNVLGQKLRGVGEGL